MQKLPAHDGLIRCGAEISPYFGWEIPVQFSSVEEESAALRGSAALFDLSCLGRIEISGSGAAERLEKLLMLSVSSLPVGAAQYGLMCNEAGGILDDLVLFRLEDNFFILTVNPEVAAADLRWIRYQAQGAGVNVASRAGETFIFSLQGPSAAPILDELVNDDTLDSLRYGRWRSVSLGGYPVSIARIANSGEDGLEIQGNAADAEKVWDLLLENGRDSGLRPAGRLTRELSRLEAGNRAINADIGPFVGPLEAGLGWAVHHDNEKAIGRGALIAERLRRNRGEAFRRWTGFIVEGEDIPCRFQNIWHKNRQVGAVTNGNFSYVIGQPIGAGYVETEAPEPGAQVEIETSKKRIPARIVKLPFIKKGRENEPA